MKTKIIKFLIKDDFGARKEKLPYTFLTLKFNLHVYKCNNVKVEKKNLHIREYKNSRHANTCTI